MQTIVLATDFSEASENAYRFCLELGSKTRTEIFVAHIYNSKGSVALNDDQRRRQHQLEFEAFRLRTIRFSRLYPDITTPDLAAHCQVATDVEEGYATEKLLELTQRHNADMLVLGAKRHPGLFRKVFGKVSERLIYSRAFPVLIVPEAFKGGYPERIGAICVNKADDEYLTDWLKTSEFSEGLEVTCFLLHGDVDPAAPFGQSDDIQVLPGDRTGLLSRLEESELDLFVIRTTSRDDKLPEIRKGLIHFLYDHLDVPLLCVPNNTMDEETD